MNIGSYPRYKHSGVDWLGDIAAHWGVRAIKHLVSTPVTDGPHSTPEIFDEGIPFVSAEAINHGRINFGKIRGYITQEDHKLFSKKYKPARGDIYLVKSGATTGRVAMVETDIEFNIWSPLAAIRCNPALVDRNYLFFFMQSKEFQTAIELSWSFGTQQNIGMGVIQNLAVPIPSLSEQRAIAKFLERETGRMDRLVEKKRELIERLNEKRIALISRTITRGLPPPFARAAGLSVDPPLKPSGIAWLGDIPAHWGVIDLFRIAERIQTGPFGSQLHSTDYVEGGTPLINPAHISGGRIFPDDLSSVDEATVDRLNRHVVRQGDIIMGRRGEIGRCAVVESREAGWLCGTGCLLIRLRNSDSFYYATIISGSGFSRLLELRAVGTTMLNLNPTIVGRMLVPVPPLPEQIAIAAYLDSEKVKLDAMVKKVEEAIERLLEYRTALITAAVTGKIDVRKAAG